MSQGVLTRPVMASGDVAIDLDDAIDLDSAEQASPTIRRSVRTRGISKSGGKKGPSTGPLCRPASGVSMPSGKSMPGLPVGGGVGAASTSLAATSPAELASPAPTSLIPIDLAPAAGITACQADEVVPMAVDDSDFEPVVMLKLPASGHPSLNRATTNATSRTVSTHTATTRTAALRTVTTHAANARPVHRPHRHQAISHGSLSQGSLYLTTRGMAVIIASFLAAIVLGVGCITQAVIASGQMTHSPQTGGVIQVQP